MKIVFMGTPDFAVGALKALLDAGHEITAVVTQPDKAKGRSGQPVHSPVKQCALEHHIPVFQPKKIKTPEAIEELRKYPADIFVVAAFGQILSQQILDMPPYGCLNIHASLLPRYRGASPIQNVILNGEEKTGVTIMQMNAGLDTGDMLYKKEIDIDRKDTFETLHDKLMVLGGESIVEALALLEEGSLIPETQDDELSCYAPLITKEMGCIDFTKDAYSIELKVRGMNPWPSAFTTYHGKQLKIWEAVAEETEAENGSQDCGKILQVLKDSVVIATGKGILKIYSMQLEGKKRMSAHDFLLGVRMQPGERLGD
ncbi:MAG: methionyl-tRNA formyltransferase [Lachnospiraceae bacterium]|nr:methionyl-tRNA formyltransferase [Lachnospiraceae bacterium]